MTCERVSDEVTDGIVALRRARIDARWDANKRDFRAERELWARERKDLQAQMIGKDRWDKCTVGIPTAFHSPSV